MSERRVVEDVEDFGKQTPRNRRGTEEIMSGDKTPIWFFFDGFFEDHLKCCSVLQSHLTSVSVLSILLPPDDAKSLSAITLTAPVWPNDHRRLMAERALRLVMTRRGRVLFSVS